MLVRKWDMIILHIENIFHISSSNIQFTFHLKHLFQKTLQVSNDTCHIFSVAVTGIAHIIITDSWKIEIVLAINQFIYVDFVPFEGFLSGWGRDTEISILAQFWESQTSLRDTVSKASLNGTSTDRNTPRPGGDGQSTRTKARHEQHSVVECLRMNRERDGKFRCSLSQPLTSQRHSPAVLLINILIIIIIIYLYDNKVLLYTNYGSCTVHSRLRWDQRLTK